MLREISEDITFLLAKNHIIEEEDREIYIYGFELIIMMLVSMGTVVLIGVISQQITWTFIFIIVFVTIRSYSGGYHADAYWKCYLVSTSTYLCILLSTMIVSIDTKRILIFPMLILSYGILFSKGPVNSKKCPKTPIQIEKNRKMMQVLITLYTIITIIGTLFNSTYINTCFIIACTQFAVSMFLLISINQSREK